MTFWIVDWHETRGEGGHRPYGTDIRQGVVLMRDFCEGPEHP